MESLDIDTRYDVNLKLLYKHSDYLRTMIKADITRSEVDLLMNEIVSVRKEGLNLYGNDKLPTWISINSHLVTHLPENIRRFGSSRNTWVYAFESQMGILKRRIMAHRNGVSEGRSMMNYVWHLILTSSVINSEKID